MYIGRHLEMYRRHKSPPRGYTIKMEAEHIPETWINIYLSTQHQIPEEFSLHKH